MKSVGIDIGASSIKVCEVIASSKGVQVVSFLEQPIGNNPAHDIDLEILEFLQNLALKYDHGQTKVVMSLRQDRVSVRTKTFPFSDRTKILKSLPFELEEDLPFSSETAIYDSRMVRSIGPLTEVLACAVPKHRVSELSEKYQNSGLSIGILTAEGLAFANCFSNWDQAPPQLPSPPIEMSEGEHQGPLRQLTLKLQLGHSHCLVCAFEDRTLVSVRSILWGAKNVASAISRKYEIPEIEAAKELRTKAFILPTKEGASYDQILFSDTIAAQFKDFGRELKLSILEIETELGAKVVSAEITGGLAGVLHLSAYLTQMIEIPVNRSSYLAGFNVSFEKSPAIENSIGTALGLALEGLRKPKNPVLQFLRGELAPKNESLQVFFKTWGKTMACVASLFVLFFIYSSLRETFANSLLDHATEQISAQAQAIAKLPAKSANESGVKKYLRDKRKRAQDMKKLEGLAKMNSALDILRTISESAPGKSQVKLNVRMLKIEGDKVFLEGTLGSGSERVALQNALTSLSKNGKIEVRGGDAAPGVLGIPFSFAFPIDRGTEQ